MSRALDSIRNESAATQRLRPAAVTGQPSPQAAGPFHVASAQKPDNGFGSVLLGRQYDSINDYIGPMTFGLSAYGSGITHPGDIDNTTHDYRTNNTIKYVSPNLDGLTFGGTVTLGIVSARNRDIQQGPYDSFIQTDASINEGNSGGPLFDMSGKVIGINTAIIAQGEASLGIGFAIPANLASPVVDQLVSFGVARRGWIGVDVQGMTDDIAASLGLGNPHGALITDVTRAGPADGLLRPGDIITSFDGKPVMQMHDLPRLVAEANIGKTVDVEIERGTGTQSIKLVVGELKGDEKPAAVTTRAAPHAPGVQATFEDLVGFVLAPIDAVKRHLYGLPNSRQGLVVTAVDSTAVSGARASAARVAVRARAARGRRIIVGSWGVPRRTGDCEVNAPGRARSRPPGAPRPTDRSSPVRTGRRGSVGAPGR